MTTFNAYETIYTVPPGYTTIIKSVNVYYRNGVSAFVYWGSLVSGGVTTRNLARLAGVTGQNWALQPYWVLEAGDSLRLLYEAATGGLPDYGVFGSELVA